MSRPAVTERPRVLPNCILLYRSPSEGSNKGITKMNITAGMVKDLREKTGAGMMDCKGALAETRGDVEAAIDLLRKKGLAKAAKNDGRIAAEGRIAGSSS